MAKRNGREIGPNQDMKRGKAKPAVRKVDSGNPINRGDRSPITLTQPQYPNQQLVADRTQLVYAVYPVGGGQVAGLPPALRTEPDPRPKSGASRRGISGGSIPG